MVVGTGLCREPQQTTLDAGHSSQGGGGELHQHTSSYPPYPALHPYPPHSHTHILRTTTCHLHYHIPCNLPGRLCTPVQTRAAASTARLHWRSVDGDGLPLSISSGPACVPIGNNRGAWQQREYVGRACTALGVTSAGAAYVVRQYGWSGIQCMQSMCACSRGRRLHWMAFRCRACCRLALMRMHGMWGQHAILECGSANRLLHTH